MKKKQKAEAEKQKPGKNRQTPEKAGLTLSEKKHLAELKRALAGNSKEQAKPDTAQKTITFKKMYRDGICQVADTYYTKWWNFLILTMIYWRWRIRLIFWRNTAS